ncbi:MAG: lipoprotein-releasing ABC transporter permease subunit [Deltaproteobacteria bacterium]|nr:lipoprotein-releasing ABC transporter permease subunit [Deltaproteobacteria bacterium]
MGMRFLRPRRKQILWSIVTVISVSGVALGVTVLIVVISVMTGFQDYMRQKSLEAYSHMVVLSFAGQIENYPDLLSRVEKFPGVIAASPFVYSEVMMTRRDNVAGVIVRGVDTASFSRVSKVGEAMDIGRLDDLNTLHAPTTEDQTGGETAPLPAVVIGSELAATLQVFPGDVIGLVTPLGEVTPMGMVPKMKQFVVTGIFTLGLFEFDSKFVFINKTDAQAFFGIGDRISGVEVIVNDVMKAPEIAMAMNEDLGWPFKVKDWTRMNENLFAAIKLEKLVMFVILSLIIFVASMNIFTTLYWTVMDKKRAIAVMRTMGATQNSILRLFLVQGMVIGAIGAVFGLLLGTGLCLAQIKFHLVRIDPKVYLIETLPMKLEMANFVIVAAAALVMSLAATIIPARTAARVDPVQVLRYE